MGANCSLDEMFNICNSGEEPPEATATNTETPETSYEEHAEDAKSEESDNRISGIEDPKQSNRNIFASASHRKMGSTGLFEVDIADLDVSTLKRNLEPHLVSVNVVKGNLLQITFNKTGFVIHPTKSEKNDGVMTLHIVDTRENYGGPQPEIQSMYSFYRIPKAVHTITCNDLNRGSKV